MLGRNSGHKWKKGEHASPKTEFKKGIIFGHKWKKGEHISPKTEFKKGMCSGKDNPNWKGGAEASRKRNEKTRREFGFTPLNDQLQGCVGHHIDKEFVIYIPEEMHRSIWHSLTKDINMDKINELAIDFCYGD